MQCPNCSLYHPSRYQNCVSCGSNLVADGELIQQAATQSTKQSRAQPRSKESEESHGTAAGEAAAVKSSGRKGPRLPLAAGIAIAGFILCASAGGTFFYLTKPPENERLYQEGQKQLELGQYAFAVKTLSEAVNRKPQDGKALLALARAYVGIDQVSKAWDCITKAQQLGAGVVAEPKLASDLANYYRQRNQYEKAVELLRPLAAADVKGKKAELADLNALWGDECIRSGNFRQAMRCWEEVKELHDGSRFAEADSRLATVYQKIADEMLTKGDDQEALKFFAKLNVSAPSASTYEKTADLYDRQGKLELAIDQMRQAIKLTNDSPMLTRKLSVLMVKRGKELLDSGEADAGFGYLQQAQGLDPRIKAPAATVRNVRLEVDGPGGNVHISGEVWNPGQDMLNALTLRAELFDKKTSKVLWTKDQRIIDEFVPPLPSRGSRAFDLNATAPFDPVTTDLRVFLNGSLYKAYSLGKGAAKTATASTGSEPLTLRPRLVPPTQTQATTMPAPEIAPQPAPNVVAPDQPAPITAPVPVPGTTSEERTLQDLD